MKRDRQFKNLERASIIVALLTVIIVILLIVSASTSISAVEKDFLGKPLEPTFPILAPYLVYIAVLGVVGYVAYEVLRHFARMEIIALDGPEAFKPAAKTGK